MIDCSFWSLIGRYNLILSVPSIAETGLASHCMGLLDSPNFAAGMRPLPGSWTSQTFRKGGVVVIAVVGRIQSKRTAENGRFTLAYHTKSIILTTRQHAPAYECILAQRRSTLGRHDREKARPGILIKHVARLAGRRNFLYILYTFTLQHTRSPYHLWRCTMPCSTLAGARCDYLAPNRKLKTKPKKAGSQNGHVSQCYHRQSISL